MLLSWWRGRRRARALQHCRIDADLWSAVVAEVPAAAYIAPAGRQRLRDLASLFLDEKSIEAARGFHVTAPMRVRVACEACIPILALDLDWYRDFHAIILYPEEFIARHEYHDEDGVVHEDSDARAGESWEAGPAIVSWEDVLEGGAGYSVVIHEMAHKLDMLDGSANGFPPLHTDMRRRDWTLAFSTAFAELQRRHERGDALELDPYALEDPGEFFAVTSEYFFTAPEVLREECPGVCQQLALFYRQQPWLAGGQE